MKAKPLKLVKEQGYVMCSVTEATYIELRLPDPLSKRIIPVIINGSRDNNKDYVWSWNGDIDKPTLRPSVLTESNMWDSTKSTYIKHRCHTWISNGEAQFLSDCTHEHTNQTIPLLDIP